MELKKPKYPFALYTYVVTKQGDAISNRKVILNDLEEQNFRERYKTQKIAADKLTKKEIMSLPITSLIAYIIPKWMFVIATIILGLAIILLTKTGEEIVKSILSKINLFH